MAEVSLAVIEHMEKLEQTVDSRDEEIARINTLNGLLKNKILEFKSQNAANISEARNQIQ
jgi:hypothetical protein